MTDQNQDEMANVDENEIVSEASMSDDPKNAETASVTGVAKAANVTTKQSPPKTKANLLWPKCKICQKQSLWQAMKVT